MNEIRVLRYCSAATLAIGMGLALWGPKALPYFGINEVDMTVPSDPARLVAFVRAFGAAVAALAVLLMAIASMPKPGTEAPIRIAGIFLVSAALGVYTQDIAQWTGWVGGAVSAILALTGAAFVWASFDDERGRSPTPGPS